MNQFVDMNKLNARCSLTSKLQHEYEQYCLLTNKTIYDQVEARIDLFTGKVINVRFEKALSKIHPNLKMEYKSYGSYICLGDNNIAGIDNYLYNKRLTQEISQEFVDSLHSYYEKHCSGKAKFIQDVALLQENLDRFKTLYTELMNVQEKIPYDVREALGMHIPYISL